MIVYFGDGNTTENHTLSIQNYLLLSTIHSHYCHTKTQIQHQVRR